MARRKKGRPVNGWVILDKPLNMTSTQAVGKVRWLFDARKAGHGGTLDPLGTGLLPIALGEATKTLPYVVDGDKVYRFTVRWGEATATLDAEGEVTETSDVRPSRDAIEAVLPRFTGAISQVPPAYSAIKIDGERAYDLARDGVEVELEAREVEIHELALIDIPDADHATFETVCGKGTYIRSLARDMAAALGTCAHVTALRRLQVGPFGEDDMISLAKLEELRHKDAADGASGEDLPACLVPIETALDDIPALAIGDDGAMRLKRGQAVLLVGRDAPVIHGPALATWRGKPWAIVEIDRGEARPKRVFNLD